MPGQPARASAELVFLREVFCVSIPGVRFRVFRFPVGCFVRGVLRVYSRRAISRVPFSRGLLRARCSACLFPACDFACSVFPWAASCEVFCVSIPGVRFRVFRFPVGCFVRGVLRVYSRRAISRVPFSRGLLRARCSACLFPACDFACSVFPWAASCEVFCVSIPGVRFRVFRFPVGCFVRGVLRVYSRRAISRVPFSRGLLRARCSACLFPACDFACSVFPWAASCEVFCVSIPGVRFRVFRFPVGCFVRGVLRVYSRRASVRVAGRR